MDKQNKQEFYCRHCGRTFTDAGVFLTHDCDAQPETPAQRGMVAIVGTMTPAQRDTVAMLYNAPRAQVEDNGDMLWA